MTKWDEWPDVRKEVRFRYFRKAEGRMLWKMIPTPRMKNHTGSSFIFQLVYRLAVCGATQDEIRMVYCYWCQRNMINLDVDKFERTILIKGWKTAQPYIQEWQAKHPLRRKQGTSRNQILDVIRNGHRWPKAICE